MDAWLIADHARRHCDDLRAQARADRMARRAAVVRRGARRHIARALVALGSMAVAAGNRVLQEVQPAS